MTNSTPTFRWEGTVHVLNTYGDQVVSKMKISIIAPTIQEATVRGRAAMGATFDDFRKFWSHKLTFERAVAIEESAPQEPTPQEPTP